MYKMNLLGDDDLKIKKDHKNFSYYFLITYPTDFSFIYIFFSLNLNYHFRDYPSVLSLLVRTFLRRQCDYESNFGTRYLECVYLSVILQLSFFVTLLKYILGFCDRFPSCLTKLKPNYYEV